MKRWLERLIERGAIALAIVTGIGVPLYWALGLWYMEAQFTRPETLLHRTDYPAIRDGCREMMAMHRRGELPSDPFLSRDDPRVPDVIRALRPVYISVDDDEIHLEMHSGSDHYGFFFYPEGSPYEGRDGGWKLIDGLWIYGVDYPQD